ncbi:sialate O-acetylesterase [bacterium 0.1xD8-71]|nr:sialate O-acetylesterase [bacterium 0.1xD8-71]
MGKLKLPRLLSDGMVLQQKKNVRIWGEDEPGRTVTVSFLGREYNGEVNAAGEWEIHIQPADACAACQMLIRDDAGEAQRIADVAVGDVFICAGQSNMELPISRVMDRYPEEIQQCDNPAIRTFKIIENAEFHGPLKDHKSGEWTAVSENTFPEFSATAYFFAKHMYRMTGAPVGLINASLGGSRIESWMGRDMLTGYEEFLALADRYSDDEFVRERLELNLRQADQWHKHLDSIDIGLKERWYRGEFDLAGWKEIEIPFFFKDTPLKDFCGSVWFYREFTADKRLAGREAKLWLGTIVDSDTVYVNGIQVGHTDYQYPPRKYTIPEGLLKEGKNTIVMHVKAEIGQGRFTDEKVYAIFRENDRIELSGKWMYRIGAGCEMIQATDFVNWKPTGLYQGMMAPCHKYAAAGILWYQGESNTHESAGSYCDLMERMIRGYRAKWEDDLPFIYVQLPNFRVELYGADRDDVINDWPCVREEQRRALKIPGTGMVTAIDLGEDNDLHPLNKEGIGFRLAMQAAKMLYGKESECEGPQIEEAEVSGKEGVWEVILTFRSATGLYADPEANLEGIVPDKRNAVKEIRDFELVDDKGKVHTTTAQIVGNKVLLTCEDEMTIVREVRYCYHNTNAGAMLYNQEGFPMTPFLVEINDRP